MSAKNPDQEEEADETCLRKLQEASWLQTLVLMWAFNHLDIRCKCGVKVLSGAFWNAWRVISWHR